MVSDTHLPRFGRTLPRALERGLRTAGVELILHCGDMTDLLVVPLFEAIAPFDAVAGNNDGKTIRERFGRRRIVEVEGARIGLVHGDGKRGSTLGRALDAFVDERVDAICFGHSHRPHRERRDGVLVINPGSPTDKRMNLRYSYAILDVRDGRVEGRLHYYLRRDP